MDTDVYFHKLVTYHAWKHSLHFRTSQELFSSHDIDTGTKFLLRSIIEAGYDNFQHILDIGCGYGPLGLTLKTLHLDSTVHLTDRNALAVEYSRQNAGLNKLSGVEIYGSLGYDDVARADFDLIVSNIPGKAGEPVIAHLLREARFYLKPGGITAIVVVSPLEKAVAAILADTPGIEIIHKHARSGHAVFHYRFAGEKPPPGPGQSAFERGVYHRKNVTMRPGNLEYNMQTAYGLPEFDSLSYGTEMLVNALGEIQGKNIKNAVVFNPGQGHVPVALWQLLHPLTITLIDRDLLALRYSQLNLTLNGCPSEHFSISHQAGLGMESNISADLVTGVLREEESQDGNILTLDRAASMLTTGGMIIISGGSTPVTRLVTYVASGGGLRIKARERRRGYSLLALEKT